MLAEQKIICDICNDGKRTITLSESNRNFLLARVIDRKLDLAITCGRIAWENFSNLEKTVDTNSIVQGLLIGFQKMFNEQIRNPISTIVTSLGVLMTTLEQNPKLIQQCSEREIETLKTQFKLLEGIINEPSKNMNLLVNMISEFMHKPNTKGSIGEKMLVDLWPQYFEHDDVKLVGNAGNEDLMVIPFLNTGINNYGEKICIERKTGKQAYTGSHFKAAVDHAIAKGASYAMLIYDTEENLSRKSTIFARDRGVLVAAVDLNSSTWRVAREMFEVLQKELGISKKAISEINIDVIQEVAMDIATLIDWTAKIRVKNGKIKSYSDGINDDLDEINKLVRYYQGKLKSAISGSRLTNDDRSTRDATQKDK
jgi:hypothetical protein